MKYTAHYCTVWRFRFKAKWNDGAHDPTNQPCDESEWWARRESPHYVIEFDHPQVRLRRKEGRKEGSVPSNLRGTNLTDEGDKGEGRSISIFDCAMPLESWSEPLALGFWRKFLFCLFRRTTKCGDFFLHTFYRVTIQLVANLPLTSRQKFRFDLARPGQARPKRNLCFEVNGRSNTTWCVTQYISQK